MRITERLTRVVAIGLAAAFVALGCGSEDSSGTGGPADRLGAAEPRERGAADQEGAAAAREKAAADREVARQQREHQQRLARKKQVDSTARSVASELKTVRIDMPDDYPADAPRYPGAWVSQVRRLPSGVMNVMFGSDDSPEKVAEWMNGNLPNDGWTNLTQREMGSGILMQGEKDLRRVNVVTSVMQGSDEQVTLIAVVVSR